MATGKYVLLCEHVHLRSDRQCEHLHPRWSHCKQVRQHWRHATKRSMRSKFVEPILSHFIFTIFCKI